MKTFRAFGPTIGKCKLSKKIINSLDSKSKQQAIRSLLKLSLVLLFMCDHILKTLKIKNYILKRFRNRNIVSSFSPFYLISLHGIN